MTKKTTKPTKAKKRTPRDPTKPHPLKGKPSGNPNGRPRKYTPTDTKNVAKWAEKVEAWKATMVDTRDTEGRLQVAIPSLERLSSYLDIARITIREWAAMEEDKLFSATLEWIEREQKSRLFEKGLSGEYNSTIAKLGLSANHGMVDRSESDNRNKNDNTITLKGLLHDIDGSTSGIGTQSASK